MSFLKSLKGYLKIKKEKNLEVVFYSESKSYCINFKDIINELVKHRVKVYYVTSSKDDKVFLFFNYLKANMLITTLPDIDTFHLKHSIYVKNMIYVHHSMASMNMIYLPKAFESYDTIFCVGAYHELECREMEEEYNTKPKILVKAGYPALDDFLNQYEEYCKTNNNHKTKDKVIITIAPSWQKDNIIDTCIDVLISRLLESDYIVRLRPHPETLKYERDKIENIVKTYKNNTNFILDNTPGSFKSYLETDIMITDWSFTVYKYAFTTFKPVIFINTPIKVRNNNYKQYKNIPVDIAWRNKIGREINIEALQNIGQLVEEMLDSKIKNNNLQLFREENIYNIGSSGKICADYIISQLNISDK